MYLVWVKVTQLYKKISSRLNINWPIIFLLLHTSLCSSNMFLLNGNFNELLERWVLLLHRGHSVGFTLLFLVLRVSGAPISKLIPEPYSAVQFSYNNFSQLHPACEIFFFSRLRAHYILLLFSFSCQLFPGEEEKRAKLRCQERNNILCSIKDGPNCGFAQHLHGGGGRLCSRETPWIWV